MSHILLDPMAVSLLDSFKALCGKPMTGSEALAMVVDVMETMRDDRDLGYAHVLATKPTSPLQEQTVVKLQSPYRMEIDLAPQACFEKIAAGYKNIDYSAVLVDMSTEQIRRLRQAGKDACPTGMTIHEYTGAAVRYVHAINTYMHGGKPTPSSNAHFAADIIPDTNVGTQFALYVKKDGAYNARRIQGLNF